MSKCFKEIKVNKNKKDINFEGGEGVYFDIYTSLKILIGEMTL